MQTEILDKNAPEIGSGKKNYIPINDKEGDSHLITTVHINPGTDLNNPVPFQKWNGQEKETGKRFPDEVFQNLPELYRLLCKQIEDPNERDVVLVGLLGVVSGVLPNYYGYYGGKKLGANLYTYILGPYGEGKSGLMLARKIAGAIHQEKVDRSKERAREYKHELARYKKEAKMFESGKLENIPEEPTPPPLEKHFIPANIGKSGMLQIINGSNGRGTLFETEADTLVEAIKQDHGGFSDVLRQAFGHEPISLFRRTNNEDLEITVPALSVVLSSTTDQLLRLIPSAENGLFSRFIFYQFYATPSFNNVFDKRKNGNSKYFSDMGLHFKELHDRLDTLTDPILFELQPHQEAKFLKYFKEQKNDFWEFVSINLGGTVNRMGMICFRIAMQLSISRAYEKGYLPLEVICTDQDFENALRIIKTLFIHTIDVYEQLPSSKTPIFDESEDKDVVRLSQKRECFDLYNKGVTNFREIAKIVFGSPTYSSTVYRWIKQ
ncbi:DUF3987 domain-containing protein [Botryobacter ruber]|uniref:DUF3987 domain-containing protein n=1 Tax=Botryobacter ruber TaxID=2171629 RepID=UPI000E0B9CCD|nr:DUF3987 domain-containing protein [Botryobacter ruber]